MAHVPSLALTLPDVHGLVLALTLALATSPNHEDGVLQPACALVEQERMVVVVHHHPTPSPTCPPSFTLVLQTCMCHHCHPRPRAPTRMARAPSFALTSPNMHMCPKSRMSSPHSPACTLTLPGALGCPHAPSFFPAPLGVRTHLAFRSYYVIQFVLYAVISISPNTLFCTTSAYVQYHVLQVHSISTTYQ